MPHCCTQHLCRAVGLTPYSSLDEVTPIELLSEGNSLGLPRGLEAPVMTSNGVFFILSFYAEQKIIEHSVVGIFGGLSTP